MGAARRVGEVTGEGVRWDRRFESNGGIVSFVGIDETLSSSNFVRFGSFAPLVALFAVKSVAESDFLGPLSSLLSSNLNYIFKFHVS